MGWGLCFQAACLNKRRCCVSYFVIQRQQICQRLAGVGKGVLGKAVFHHAGDVGKQNFSAQKGGNGDFVGSIEHARGSAAKIERVVGEF